MAPVVLWRYAARPAGPAADRPVLLRRVEFHHKENKGHEEDLRKKKEEKEKKKKVGLCLCGKFFGFLS
jgi:hypothetical protein